MRLMRMTTMYNRQRVNRTIRRTINLIAKVIGAASQQSTQKSTICKTEENSSETVRAWLQEV